MTNLFLQTSSKKSRNFLIFCPVLTNFLPKCGAQNVDSEKGPGAGKKGMALEKKAMVRRHSKNVKGKHFIAGITYTVRRPSDRHLRLLCRDSHPLCRLKIPIQVLSSCM